MSIRPSDGQTVTLDWSGAQRNPAQLGFVSDTKTRHTGFVGGLGSGKTWSGAIKGILYALQWPDSLGVVAAPTYRQLRDSTQREFFKLLPPELVESYNKSDYELKLTNGSEVLFRSLENYDSLRGIEIAWLWIDEANLVSHKAWQVAIGRLRQPGFPTRSWITTTPRGKTLNWVYEEYVERPKKEQRLSRRTYHAKTRDNMHNVGVEYVLDLEATYTGEFAKQELEGQFVDIIEGRVYEQFSRELHVDFFGEEIFFNPELPLFGFWDYGIGDEGALWVAQTVDFPPRSGLPILDTNTGEMKERWLPRSRGLLLLDLILEAGENVEFWIDQVKIIEDQLKPFDSHWGDPAGEQRTATTGKSMAQHLREGGVYVRSKKVPYDDGFLAIHRLLNDRLLAISSECEIGIAAFTNYHWPLDDDGNRKVGSTKPVHDWSSHPMDALRYGASGLFPALAPGKFNPGNKQQKTRVPRAAPKFASARDRTW